MGFVVEILDGLVIQQTIHGLRVSILIALIHFTAELNTPARDRESEPDVEPDHRKSRERDPPIQLDDHDGAEERQLENCREDVEHGEREQRINAARPPLDDAAEPARLPLQMEAKRQRVYMRES